METEHTYAPPFSSAKDPIAIGGYVASNIISGAMPVISWRELVEEKDKVMLIDTPYARGILFRHHSGSRQYSVGRNARAFGRRYLQTSR